MIILNGIFMMLGVVIIINIIFRGIIKKRCIRGFLVVGGGCRGLGGTFVLVEGSRCLLYSVSVCEDLCREVCVEILVCIFNVYVGCFIFVLYMIKYIYIFICLMFFM